MKMSSSSKITSVRFIAYVALLILFVAVMCDAHTEVFQRQTRKKFCGKILSETLAILCNGKYNTMTKKSDEYELTYADEPIDDSQLPPLFNPFTSRIVGTSIIPRAYRRIRRGVNDECCKQSCSIAELMTYCSKY